MTQTAKKTDEKSINPSVLKSFNNIYHKKRVLVTGHTGFKGSWLSLWLHALGADVIGYSLPPNTEPSNFIETKLEHNIVHVTGDIRDEEQVLQVFQSYKPEFVFHLAAQSLVRLSYKNPKLTYETNIIGLVNLYEAIRKTDSVQVVVNITSDKCYENKEWIWGYRESDQMGGYDPYSSSKACSELITSAYQQSFFNSQKLTKNNVALASVRAGNIIGGGDWAQDRLVPDCIRSLHLRKSIKIRFPDAIRPWQHILEPLSGYLWLGALLYTNKNKFSSAWNFGPSDTQEISVKRLVNKIIQKWGEGDWFIDPDSKNQPHEANYLKLDCSKARKYLNWKPLLNTDETINLTLDWYRNFYDNSSNAYDLCLSQIKYYTTVAKSFNSPWMVT